MTVTQFSDSISQEDDEFHNNQQNSLSQAKFQNISVNKQIELAKLRVQQLQLKLQAQRLAAGLNSISNSFQSTFSVQFI